MQQQYTDIEYYAEFEGRIRGWMTTVNYVLGDIVSVDGSDWQATAASIGERPSEANSNWNAFTRATLGSGRFVCLEDMINNYMAIYSDPMSHGGGQSRYVVEFWAKRSIQEFSYDVFTTKHVEFQPSEIPLWPMPQDYVSLVAISYTDQNGTEQRLRPRTDSGNPRSALQASLRQTITGFSPTRTYRINELASFGDNFYRALNVIDPNEIGFVPQNPDASADWEEVTLNDSLNYLYDSDGNQLFSSSSVEQARWDGRNDRISPLSQGGFNSFEGGYNAYGRRFYIDPESANRNGTYYINQESGTITVEADLGSSEQSVQQQSGFPLLSIQYVSDGMDPDPAKVKVPKYAEEAIYDTIYSGIVNKRRDVPANEKQKAMKDAYAKRRNAKIRLTGFSQREMIATFRNKNRWIKV